VTEAQPSRIKRIFRNARVIGRRFRLVHVYAGSKIFEVSTFRSIANGTIGNEYGTIDEDARRRDFTMNALYYDPHDSLLVDYVGGFKDISARRVKQVIPLKEDPVRMIRCVKYASMAGFKIPLGMRLAIRRDSGLLSEASPSRLTEEFLKILASGTARAILKSLLDFDLLRHMLPETAGLATASAAYRSALYEALDELDAHAQDPEQDKRLALLLAHFLKPFLEARSQGFADTPEAYQEAVHESRLFLRPLNPPRAELEAAVLVVFKKRGLSPLQRPRRQVSERGSGRTGERRTEARQGAEAPRKRRKRRKPAPRAPELPGTGEAGNIVGAPDLGPEAPPQAPPLARRRRRRRGTSGPRGESPPGKGPNPAD
jgi:poly(A) polymerase